VSQTGVDACRVLSHSPQVGTAVALGTAAVAETEFRCSLRADPGADSAADAFFFPVADSSVTFPVHGTGRAVSDAFRLVAVNAGTGKMKKPEGVFAGIHCNSAAEKQPHFQVVFVLACHLADIAADAFFLVVDKSETLHRELLFCWIDHQRSLFACMELYTQAEIMIRLGILILSISVFSAQFV
jgi:hypothetical protein